MRKIIRYASISWDAKEWKKQLYWIDLDTGRFRGVPVDEHGRSINALEDKHVMFALVAQKMPSEITIAPLERDTDPLQLKIRSGFSVYVGNGFLLWETEHESQS